MKHLVLAALLVAAPSMATTKEQLAVCTALSDLAGVIMEARQTGTPLSKIMEVSYKDAGATKIIQALAMEAYKAPRYNTPQYQQREIDDFKNTIMMLCLENKKSHSPT